MEALSTATKVPAASPASHHQNKPDVNAKEDVMKMLPPVFYQAKLTVGAPDDPLEKKRMIWLIRSCVRFIEKLE